jgi:hypothetical protein
MDEWIGHIDPWTGSLPGASFSIILPSICRFCEDNSEEDAAWWRKGNSNQNVLEVVSFQAVKVIGEV